MVFTLIPFNLNLVLLCFNFHVSTLRYILSLLILSYFEHLYFYFVGTMIWRSAGGLKLWRDLGLQYDCCTVKYFNILVHGFLYCLNLAFILICKTLNAIIYYKAEWSTFKNNTLHIDLSVHLTLVLIMYKTKVNESARSDINLSVFSFHLHLKG